jgi:hypothetical protein
VRTPLRAVLAGGTLVLALALAHVLGHTRTQIAGTDRVPNNVFVTGLAKGQQLCQRNEIVPEGTAALRMTIGTDSTPGHVIPGPPLAIDITAPATARGAAPHRVSSAAIAAGWRQGVVTLPVPAIRRTYGNATVCIRDRGTKIALAGTTYPNEYGFTDYFDGTELTSEVRIDYLLPGKPSWSSMLSTLAYRLTLGKGSYIRPLGWIAPLLLMLAITDQASAFMVPISAHQ